MALLKAWGTLVATFWTACEIEFVALFNLLVTS